MKIYGVFHQCVTLDNTDNSDGYYDADCKNELVFASDDLEFCKKYVGEHSKCLKTGAYGLMMYGGLYVDEIKTNDDINKPPHDILGRGSFYWNGYNYDLKYKDSQK